MPQTMTLDEKLATINQAFALKEAGDGEAYNRMMRTVPVPPYIAKVIKEKVGSDFLVKEGWNLSEAEAKFGNGWLNK